MFNRLPILPTLCFLFAATTVAAQKTQLSQRIILEAGTEFFSVKPVNKPYIRLDNRGRGLLAGGVRGTFSTVFAGAKAALLTSKKRWGFSAGLRYSFLQSEIYKNTLFHNYFYLLHRQTGTTTEYLTIRRLEEKSHYIGIPAEVRFYLSAKRTPGVYFNVGGEVDYQLTTSLHTTFNNPGMSIFRNDVEVIVGSSNQWYGWIFFGGGMCFGRDGVWAIGLNVPIVLTRNTSRLNTPLPAIGIQIQRLLWTKE